MDKMDIPCAKVDKEMIVPSTAYNIFLKEKGFGAVWASKESLVLASVWRNKVKNNEHKKYLKMAEKERIEYKKIPRAEVVDAIDDDDLNSQLKQEKQEQERIAKLFAMAFFVLMFSGYVFYIDSIDSRY